MIYKEIYKFRFFLLNYALLYILRSVLSNKFDIDFYITYALNWKIVLVNGYHNGIKIIIVLKINKVHVMDILSSILPKVRNKMHFYLQDKFTQIKLYIIFFLKCQFCLVSFKYIKKVSCDKLVELINTVSKILS